MDHDAHRLEARGDLLGHVLVLEGQDPRLAVDDVDLRLAEVGEHRRVLAADDAGADDDHALGERRECLDLVARDDELAVDGDAVGDARSRAGREHEVLRFDLLDGAVETLHLELVGREEAAAAANERDDAAVLGGTASVASCRSRSERRSDTAVAHGLDDVRVRDVEAAGRAVAAIGARCDGVVVGQVPHRLRRERAGVDARTADLSALHDDDSLAEIVRTHRGRIAAGPRSEHAQVPGPARHVVSLDAMAFRGQNRAVAPARIAPLGQAT